MPAKGTILGEVVARKAAGYRVAMWLPRTLRRWLPAALLLAALGCAVATIQTSPPVASAGPASLPAAAAAYHAAARPSEAGGRLSAAPPAALAARSVTGVSPRGTDCADDVHLATPPDMSGPGAAVAAGFALLPVCLTPPQIMAPRPARLFRAPSAVGLVLTELAVRRT